MQHMTKKLYYFETSCPWTCFSSNFTCTCDEVLKDHSERRYVGGYFGHLENVLETPGIEPGSSDSRADMLTTTPRPPIFQMSKVAPLNTTD